MVDEDNDKPVAFSWIDGDPLLLGIAIILVACAIIAAIATACSLIVWWLL